MVFTQGPLSLGDSFGNEARNASVTFSPMETAAHPRTLFKRRTFGKMIATLTSFTSLWTGVVKTFRWTSQIHRIVRPQTTLVLAARLSHDLPPRPLGPDVRREFDARGCWWRYRRR